jgi:hypothetical protein
MTHTSIPLAADPWSELHGSRVALGRILGEEQEVGPTCFSFPNGRYNAAVLSTARKAGYSCLFTSDPHLNRLDGGALLPSLVLGRVNISQQSTSDEKGNLRPELLASALFWRPVTPARRVE